MTCTRCTPASASAASARAAGRARSPFPEPSNAIMTSFATLPLPPLLRTRLGCGKGIAQSAVRPITRWCSLSKISSTPGDTMQLLHLNVVLAAIDKDDSSVDALRGADGLAKAAGAKLHVVHVARSDAPGEQGVERLLARAGVSPGEST